MEPLPAAALAGISIVALVLARRVRSLVGEVAELTSRVDGIAARLAAAEDDAAGAFERAEVAETVLLDKGLADEEDLEAARRRPDASPADAGHNGDLH